MENGQKNFSLPGPNYMEQLYHLAVAR